MANDSSRMTDAVPTPDNEPTPIETDAGADTAAGEGPLARVRYGLGKELQLFPELFVVALLEEHAETQFNLANIRKMILAPGDPNPSKLVLLFELDDGNTVIAAEGMSNVRDFRKLLTELERVAPAIELEPPDMDAQLSQALDIRKRSLVGCYGLVLGACALISIVYAVVALISHLAH